VRLALQDRADAYAAAFPDRPPLQLVREAGRDVAYGTWVLGREFRNRTRYYGTYPPGLLDRVHCLFTATGCFKSVSWNEIWFR
jgi:hypothetical protein